MSYSIPENERTLAALTHLSGLAGYLIPLGGVIVPIVIWVVKSDSRVISSIARQALWLNIAVFLLAGAFGLLALTIILLPVSFVAWAVIGLVAIALPIVGAIKAVDGTYYRYPLIGSAP